MTGNKGDVHAVLCVCFEYKKRKTTWFNKKVLRPVSLMCQYCLCQTWQSGTRSCHLTTEHAILASTRNTIRQCCFAQVAKWEQKETTLPVLKRCRVSHIPLFMTRTTQNFLLSTTALWRLFATNQPHQQFMTNRRIAGVKAYYSPWDAFFLPSEGCVTRRLLKGHCQSRQHVTGPPLPFTTLYQHQKIFLRWSKRQTSH